MRKNGTDTRRRPVFHPTTFPSILAIFPSFPDYGVNAVNQMFAMD